jgi:hypothetical protein
MTANGKTRALTMQPRSGYFRIAGTAANSYGTDVKRGDPACCGPDEGIKNIKGYCK